MAIEVSNAPLDAQLSSKHLLQHLQLGHHEKHKKHKHKHHSDGSHKHSKEHSHGANGLANSNGDVTPAEAPPKNPLLERRINFVEMTAPDRAYEDLRRKYAPVNPDAVFGNRKVSGGRLPGEGTDASSTPFGAAAPGGAASEPQILDPRHIPRTWIGIHPTAPGLGNLGNTCFLNSSLQCLAHTPPLAEYLLSGHHGRTCRLKGSAAGAAFCMTCELEKFVNRCFRTGESGQQPQNQAFAPKGIVSRLKSIGKQFKLGRQEDAHEFVRMVVDAMQTSATKSYFGNKEVKRVDPKLGETTLPSHLFSGLLRSRLTCLVCKHTSDTFDPFMDLPLDLTSSSISGCLSGFVKPEILKGKDAYWTCEKCRKRVETKKEVRIERAPWILVVQLKRFGFQKGMGAKITRPVTVERELDISKFTTAGEKANGAPVPAQNYELYALTLHHGHSLRSGHYTAYVKAANGIWYHMDDERRSQVGWERVQQAGASGAYLAWYVRRGGKAGAQPAAGQQPEKKKPAQEAASGKKEEVPKKLANGPAMIPDVSDVGEKLDKKEAKQVAKMLDTTLLKRKRQEESDGEAEKKSASAKPAAATTVVEPPRKKQVSEDRTPRPVPDKLQATSGWIISTGKEAEELQSSRAAMPKETKWTVQELMPSKPKAGAKVVEAKPLPAETIRHKKDAKEEVAKHKAKSVPVTPAVQRLPSPPKTEPTRPVVSAKNGVVPVVNFGNDKRAAGSDSDDDDSSASSSDDDEADSQAPPVSPKPPPIRTDVGPKQKPQQNGIEVSWDASIAEKRTALDSVIRRESELRGKSAAKFGSTPANGDILRNLIDEASSPHVELWTPDGGNSPELSPFRAMVAGDVKDRWATGTTGKEGKIGNRPSSYDIEYDTGKTKKVKSKEEKLRREQAKFKKSGLFAKLGEQVSKRAATADGRMETAEEDRVRVKKKERDDMRAPKRTTAADMMDFSEDEGSGRDGDRDEERGGDWSGSGDEDVW